MNGGYEDEDTGAAVDETTTTNDGTRCNACGEYGHKMRTNKKCIHYKQRKSIADDTGTDGATAGIIKDANEQALLDAVPFEDDETAKLFFAADADYAEDDDDYDGDTLLSDLGNQSAII